MAWDSKDGILLNLESNETYMSLITGCLNTTFGKTTSYKYGLLKSILDNVFNVNQTDLKLSFDDLSYTFCKMYWNLVLKYKLPQKQGKSLDDKSSIEILIFSIIKKNQLLEFVDFDNLNNKDKNEYLKQGSVIFGKYVVGALYSEFKGKLFGFSKKDSKNKFIYFNENSYEFILKNKTVIEKLNYYSWIIWTEKILERWNLGIDNVAIKLENSTKRQSLNELKKELLLIDENICFYCGKKVNGKSCHLDHFIPWVFVKNDDLWNLVISCSNCNLRKNDKLPPNRYLNKLVFRNRDLFNIETAKKLELLYESAVFNGLKKWELGE